MASKLSNGGASPMNCARKIAGPFMVAGRTVADITFSPVQAAAHLSAGAMFGELSLDPSPLAGKIAIVETTPRPRKSSHNLEPHFLFPHCILPPLSVRGALPSGMSPAATELRPLAKVQRYALQPASREIRLPIPLSDFGHPCRGSILIHKHCPVNLRRSSPLAVC